MHDVSLNTNVIWTHGKKTLFFLVCQCELLMLMDRCYVDIVRGIGSKHGKLYYKCSLKRSRQVGFDMLNLKILFSSKSYMNIFFNFVETLNKDYMFKIGSNKFLKIQAKFRIYFMTFK
jgi:hypothetical protein